jgi:hypothetical protein
MPRRHWTRPHSAAVRACRCVRPHPRFWTRRTLREGAGVSSVTEITLVVSAFFAKLGVRTSQAPTIWPLESANGRYPHMRGGISKGVFLRLYCRTPCVTYHIFHFTPVKHAANRCRTPYVRLIKLRQFYLHTNGRRHTRSSILRGGISKGVFLRLYCRTPCVTYHIFHFTPVTHAANRCMTPYVRLIKLRQFYLHTNGRRHTRSSI